MDELKDCWMALQDRIREIEAAHPNFKADFDKNDDYTNYVRMKGMYSGTSFAHGKLFDFMNQCEENANNE